METQPLQPGDRAASLNEEQLRWMYGVMVEQRRFEEFAARSYGMGKIYGFCHLYIGQEAISTGVEAALEDSDIVVTAYREHGQAIARGIPAQAVMDELYGKKTGCTGGIGGSMHLYSKERNFYGGWGIVGQQVPLAAGVAFAQKYRETGAVTVCYLGDGAVHQGAIHETLNLSSLWSLPVVFIIENNKYAMGTAVERASSLLPLHSLAEPYGIAHGSFDGMDVLATYERVSEAVDLARKEGKPSFLEAECYRYRGHSMSDPAKYRSKDEVSEEKRRDPIDRFGRWLKDKGLLTDEEIESIDDRAKEAMKEILQNAERAPWPDDDAIFENVYAD